MADLPCWHVRRSCTVLVVPHSAQPLPARADLVVVGAGIVGLAHALEAHSRGLTVAVVERDAYAVGASVRNFGHGCVTAQDGEAFTYALAARERWLTHARQAGFWAAETGTVVVARHDDELAVLADLVALRDGAATLLDPDGVASRLPHVPDDVVGGAFLALDVRVDPRTAVPALGAWLAAQPRASIHWSTTFHGTEPGAGTTLVRTSRGDVVAGRVVVAVGHDVDRHYPAAATAAGVQRCTLQMLRVALPGAASVEPGVLSGTSLLRYAAFARSPHLAHVRARLAATQPALLDAEVNLMLTQRPDGTVLLGDSHTAGPAEAPFRAEPVDELLLREGAALLGTGPLHVLERWTGTYATAPGQFLVTAAEPGVLAVSVTSGIGMTTALGLAPHTLDSFL